VQTVLKIINVHYTQFVMTESQLTHEPFVIATKPGLHTHTEPIPTILFVSLKQEEQEVLSKVLHI